MSTDKNTLPALAMDEHQLLAVLENSLYPGAAPTSIGMVVNYCRAAGLDPMQKPVHIVPMWDSKSQRMRDIIMPGVGLYRTQAARSGAYAGMSEPEFGEDVTEKIGGVDVTYPRWCRVTARRLMANGAIAEFTAREFWKENYAVKGGKEKSVAPNSMWMRRAYAQLAKCAQAQALRIAFPEMTGAQPTADEMEGREIEEGVIIEHATQKPSEPTPYPDDQFAKNLPLWKKAISEGKKTADQIIAMVSSKGVLTDKQKLQIRGQDTKQGNAQSGPGHKVTFEMVAEKLNQADGLDVLDLTADLIVSVADPEQRSKLSEIYTKRRAELAGE